MSTNYQTFYKKPIAPVRLKNALEAVSWNPSRLDPDVKKLYNKWNREYKKWEKVVEKEETRKQEFWEKWEKKEDIKREIQRGIELEEKESKAYNKLIWDTNNTEDWGVEYDCRYDGCDGKISRKVINHHKAHHYAFLECSLCGRHQKWLKNPEFYDEDNDDW